MGNAPSVTGPDRGRSHVIRDDDSSVDSQTGQRPVRPRVEETVAQLAEETSDEETNRKSSSLSVPESHASHICLAFSAADIEFHCNNKFLLGL